MPPKKRSGFGSHKKKAKKPKHEPVEAPEYDEEVDQSEQEEEEAAAEEEEEEEAKPISKIILRPGKKGKSGRNVKPKKEEPNLEDFEPDMSPAEIQTSCLDILKQLSVLPDPEDADAKLAALFFRLPSRKVYPEYYQLIQEPISLQEIKSKATKKQYKTLNEFLEDVNKMKRNANFFNDEDSIVALNSNSLYDFAKDQVNELKALKYKEQNKEGEEEEDAAEDEAEEKITVTSRSPTKIVLKTGRAKKEPEKPKSRPSRGRSEQEKSATEVNENGVRNFTEKLRRVNQLMIDNKVPKRGMISHWFMELVDAKEYPDYYKVIKEGMSFNKIFENLDNGVYSNGLEGVREFKKHSLLMFENAIAYNEENSLIVRDAVILENAFYRKWARFKELNPDAFDGTETDDEEEVEELKGRFKSKKRRSVKEEGEDEGDEEEEEEEGEEEEEEEEEEPEEELNFTRNHIESIKSNSSFIQKISVSSSIKQYYGMSIDTSSQTEFFEFIFPKLNGSKTNSFSLNLPNNIGSIVIFATLNEELLKRKYTSGLTVNGESINPIPSALYSDQIDGDEDELDADEKEELLAAGLTKVSTFVASKYELKLGVGLNLIEFLCSVPPVLEVDENGKLPPRHQTSTSNPENFINESCKLWVNVTQ